MQQIERPVLRSRVWPLACGVLAAVLLVVASIGVEQPVAAGVILVALVATAAAVLVWATAHSRRQRHEHEEQLTAWAAERAAQEERLRIARELHDLASHGLGLVTVRAAAARRVEGPAGEDERRRALADIEQAAREATAELRRMLTLLRTPGEPAAPRQPTETLADLGAAVAIAEAAGLSVDITAARVDDVSPGIQVTALAIIREGLANVAKHAGPVAAQVDLARSPGVLVVTIDDGGAAPGWYSAPGSGHGLTGLQERVAVLGGDLEAGRHGTGFRLRARLPDRVSR